jgi:anti-sigma B factor antagonist
MDLDVRHDATTACVRVTGALDLSTAPELYRALDEIRAGGTRAIRLDVAGVDFVDSSALSVLLRWHNEATERDEHFSVQGARGLVKRVLRETGTAPVLER